MSKGLLEVWRGNRRSSIDAQVLAPMPKTLLEVWDRFKGLGIDVQFSGSDAKTCHVKFHGILPIIRYGNRSDVIKLTFKKIDFHKLFYA